MTFVSSLAFDETDQKMVQSLFGRSTPGQQATWHILVSTLRASWMIQCPEAVDNFSIDGSTSIVHQWRLRRSMVSAFVKVCFAIRASLITRNFWK